MQANHDTLVVVLNVLQISVIVYAVYKGVFSAGSQDASIKSRVAQIERWIAAHQVCNDKQIEILDEVRDGLSFIKGKLDRDD